MTPLATVHNGSNIFNFFTENTIGDIGAHFSRTFDTN